MTTRLDLYNKALMYCSETPLATLTDNSKQRRVMDTIYDGGAVRKVLEEGLWNAAIRVLKIEPESSVTPPFGYKNAFAQPSDFVRVNAFSADEYFSLPLLRYVDESGYWYADEEAIYVSYISDDPSFGGDLSRWPESLTEAAARWMASVAAHAFNKAGTEIDRMEKAARQAFILARGRDAMNQPTTFAPPGRWVTSRGGSGGNDDGSRPRGWR